MEENDQRTSGEADHFDSDSTSAAVQDFMRDTDKYVCNESDQLEPPSSFLGEEQTSGLNDTFDLVINGTLDSRLLDKETMDDSSQVCSNT